MLGRIEKLYIKESDLDSRGNIRAARLLYFFQEIAAAHATELGIGYDNLIKDNRIWVLSKVRYCVGVSEARNKSGCETKEDSGIDSSGQNREKIASGCITPGEYVLETYPRQRKGVTYHRDYYVKDLDGNVIVASESHWCVINFETRRIERANLEFGDDYIGYKAIPDGITKIRSGDMVLACSHIVAPEDMDINGHTNNCRYADMIEAASELNGFRDFAIHFVKETKLGDEIMIYHQVMDSGEIIEGRVDDGVVFQAVVK